MRWYIAPLALVLLSIPSGGVAQAGHPLLHDALLAQVSGPGGCAELDQVRRIADRYFPAVTMFEAECLLEHGDTAHAYAGVDTAGSLFQLGSAPGHNLLVRRYPPHLTATDVPLYARWAAIYRGALPRSAIVVERREDVPAELLSRLGRPLESLPRPGITDTYAAFWRVNVLGYLGECVLSVELFVTAQRGTVYGIRMRQCVGDATSEMDAA